MPNNFTTTYDAAFSQNPHLVNFPQMTPFVGKYYPEQKKKVLIIGESHYLPPQSTIHLTSSKWYNSTIEDLDDDEKGWSNTIGVIDYAENQQYCSKAHWIFKNIELAILESGFNPSDKSHMFKYVAFYNYFQRPALTGDSIIYDEVDKNISAEFFKFVIDTITPDFVCFMSKKPWEVSWEEGFVSWDMAKTIYNLKIGNNAQCDFFPHPSSKYWNTKLLKYELHEDGIPRTGKQKFVEFMCTNNVFD